jgi:branched-chain amino acid transport system permease protein
VTDLLRTLVAGIAVGGRVALVAIGLSLILRTSGVISFAQGAWLLLGAYLVSSFVESGLSFWLAVPLVMAIGSALSTATYRFVVRPMRGHSSSAVVLVTLGILGLVRHVAAAIWGTEPRNLGDPFGVRTMSVGDVVIPVRDVFSVVSAVIVLAFVVAVLRATPIGLATRAVALDREAAATQGIDAERIVTGCWAIAGVTAVVAGLSASAGAGRVDPGIVDASFVALVAVVVGGADSPAGGVVAAFALGIAQQLVAWYQPQHVDALGANFEGIFPYVVMVIVLIVRPTGLAGQAETWRP